MLDPTPANLRAELARYSIQTTTVAKQLGVNVNSVYLLLNERRIMRGNLQYRIAAVINQLLGKEIFSLPPGLGGEILDEFRKGVGGSRGPS